MSKKNKSKQKIMIPGGDRALKIFKIPLPEEFIFPKVDVTGLHIINEIIDENSHLKAQVAKMRKESDTREKKESKTPSVDQKTLAVIATNAWRAQNKMVDPMTGEAKEEMKRVYRYIETIIESLSQMGIQIIDPVGHQYDSGMALNVLSYEPTPGLTKEEIKETIKPSIALNGHLIQMGEVIIGTPQTT